MNKYFKLVLTLLLSIVVLIISWTVIKNIDNKDNISPREIDIDNLVVAKVGQASQTKGKISFKSDIIFPLKSKGETVDCTQYLEQSNYPTVEKGDRVVLLSYGKTYIYQYPFRLDKIIILAIILMIFIFLIGGEKGFFTVISLGITCVTIFMVYIPAICKGLPIIPLTALTSIFIISTTLLIIYGYDKKSFCAIIGCSITIIITCIVTIVMQNSLCMTGHISQKTYLLSDATGMADKDLPQIIFSMVTIGCLGAVMDVCISLASSLYEIKQTNQAITYKSLCLSGFHIGRDMIGTMTNTLILAYLGSSMITLLLYCSFKYPLINILCREEIIFELLQSLIGTLGILLAVPLTIFVSSAVYTDKKHR